MYCPKGAQFLDRNRPLVLVALLVATLSLAIGATVAADDQSCQGSVGHAGCVNIRADVGPIGRADGSGRVIGLNVETHDLPGVQQGTAGEMYGIRSVTVGSVNHAVGTQADSVAIMAGVVCEGANCQKGRDLFYADSCSPQYQGAMCATSSFSTLADTDYAQYYGGKHTCLFARQIPGGPGWCMINTDDQGNVYINAAPGARVVVAGK